MTRILSMMSALADLIDAKCQLGVVERADPRNRIADDDRFTRTRRADQRDRLDVGSVSSASISWSVSGRGIANSPPPTRT